jgi:hypothetical protein
VELVVLEEQEVLGWVELVHDLLFYDIQQMYNYLQHNIVQRNNRLEINRHTEEFLTMDIQVQVQVLGLDLAVLALAVLALAVLALAVLALAVLVLAEYQYIRIHILYLLFLRNDTF